MEGIINIAGVMPRIGTTTTALQLIQFLKRMGYDAAYVEANAQEYIWGVTSLYQGCVKDKMPGKVTYAGIDLYSKERLPELVSGGAHYDYIICDYGNIEAKTFDQQAFQDCGAMIIVAGGKPNEIFATERALKDKALAEAVYVFSFIREADREDIRGMMQDRAGRTAFAPYMPDPFEAERVGDTCPADDCFWPVMESVTGILEGGAGNGQV